MESGVRHSCRLLLLLSTFAIFAINSLASATPKLIALVVGNQGYLESRLEQAQRDASEMARILGKLGFSVVYRHDLDKKALENEVAAFTARAGDLGADGVTFFYYAGHGAQDERGNNFLIPIDSAASSPEEVRSGGVPLSALLTGLQNGGTKVNVVVLDACRERFRTEARRGLRRGLSDVGRLHNVLLAMSTSPGDVVDETDAQHSPFAARLIEDLETHPDMPLPALFNDVQSKVWIDTENGESPENISGLADDVSRWAISNPTHQSTTMATKPPLYAAASSAYLNSLSRDQLLAFTDQRTSFVDGLLERRDQLVRFQVSTRLRLAYFLAISSYETAHYRYLNERLNFTASALRQLFRRQFPDNKILSKYLGHPDLIANRIYANRNGNGDEASGDGWKFRGRGLLVLTGRDNYRRIGKRIGVDLESAPDLIDDPEVSLAAALAFWDEMGLDQYADNDDMKGLTRQFVGALIGMPQRMNELRRAMEIGGL